MQFYRDYAEVEASLKRLHLILDDSEEDVWGSALLLKPIKNFIEKYVKFPLNLTREFNFYVDKFNNKG